MLETLLSSGVGYLFGKIWGTIGFVIQKNQERKDKELAMRQSSQTHEQEKEMMALEAKNAQMTQERQFAEKIAMAEKVTEQQVIEADKQIATSDNQIKSIIHENDAKIGWLYKCAGVFRIIVGACSVIYMYGLGVIAIVVSVKFGKFAPIILELFDGMDERMQPILLNILSEYANMPLNIMNVMFHTSIGIATFYFGTTHTNRQLSSKK